MQQTYMIPDKCGLKVIPVYFSEILSIFYDNLALIVNHSYVAQGHFILQIILSYPAKLGQSNRRMYN